MKITKLSDWKCNFENIEGNTTNQALYKAYYNIVESEGYGHEWPKKSAREIKAELKAIFSEIGINPQILDFDATLPDFMFEKQVSFQLWHLIYLADKDFKVSE